MGKTTMGMGMGFALILSGCGAQGPSKSDVAKSLGRHFEQASGGMTTTFEDLEVGRCEKVSDGPGFACGVTAKAFIDLGNRKQEEALRGTFVFDQIGGQWSVIDAR